MSKRSRHNMHYTDFADDLNIDAVEEHLDFTVIDHVKGEDVGYCLFPENHSHGDTTGKMSINREKKVYHCWVCGGGSLLSLAMEVKGLDEESATEWLNQFAHGDIRSSDELLDEFYELIERHKDKLLDRMPHFNERVLARFGSNAGNTEITGEENELFEWAQSRGISDEVVVTHRLGYSDYLKKVAPIRNGVKIDDDYYGPCIVLPHFWEGRLVGWQHRWLNHGIDTPKWLPKYTNTSDFPKSETLYNYDEAVTRDEPVIVVESVPTALFLVSFGFSAVAAFGSGIKESQLRLLRRFQGGVIVSPDNDKAGAKFAEECKDYLSQWTRVTVLPPVGIGEGMDMGDLVDFEDPESAIHAYLMTGEEPDLFGLNDE